MVQRNITIAIIIIVIFIILAIAGFGIYAVQNHVSFFSKRKEIDEESEGGG
jgi:cytochrome c-type biogenesis protein CcmE